MSSGDGHPYFSSAGRAERLRASGLFDDSPSTLEHVWVGPGSGLAVLMPTLRRSMSPIDADAGGYYVVEVEHVLNRTEEGYAGSYEVCGFAMHHSTGVPLTPAVIRSVPLGEIFSEALLVSYEDDPFVTEDDLLEVAADRIVRYGGPDRKMLAIGLADVQPTEQERICLVYTLAKLFGRDTNRVVAKHLGITPAAAAQRIRRLRRDKFLPPASGQGARRS